MSDASPAEVLDWVQKCVANPEAALTAVQGMVEADPSAENGYMVHASRFLAFGRQALDRVERNAGDSSEEMLALCEKSVAEYSLARDAKDAISVEEEVREETVVVKPAGLFSKARTEVRKTNLKRARNNMDWPLLENHLDGVALILEKARPKSVQQLLGKTKLLYILAAGRLSIANAVQRQIDGDDSTKADVRSLCEAFIEAPFKVGSVLLASYMDTGNRQLIVIACKLFEELEAFGPGDKQNPGSMLMVEKRPGQTCWTMSPIKPLRGAL